VLGTRPVASLATELLEIIARPLRQARVDCGCPVVGLDDVARATAGLADVTRLCGGLASTAIAETNSSVPLASPREIIGKLIRLFTGYTTITIGWSRWWGRKATSARNACYR